MMSQRARAEHGRQTGHCKAPKGSKDAAQVDSLQSSRAAAITGSCPDRGALTEVKRFIQECKSGLKTEMSLDLKYTGTLSLSLSLPPPSSL